MPTYERLDYGTDDGSQWGDTLARLGMYGVTPVMRYDAVGQASTYSWTSSEGATGTTYGFSTIAAFTSLVYQVSTLIVAARRIGLIT